MCFFLVQGTNKRGIYGRGVFTSEAFVDEKWDGSGKPEHYVNVKVLNYEDYEKPFIPIEELYSIAPDYDWTPRNSGRKMEMSIGQAINQKMRMLGLILFCINRNIVYFSYILIKYDDNFSILLNSYILA